MTQRTYTEEHRQKLRENALKASAAAKRKRDERNKQEHTERQARKRIARKKLYADMRSHREWSAKQ